MFPLTPSIFHLQRTGLSHIKVERSTSNEIHPSKKSLYERTCVLFFNDFFYFAGENTLSSFGKNIKGLIASLESECEP